jgi:hypothetical protein
MRNSRAFFSGVLMATTLLNSSPGRAAFELQPSGARSSAMANAFTAVGDDSSAIFFNPAGLWQVSQPEVIAQYGRLLAGLDDRSNIYEAFLSWAKGSQGQGVGVGYHELTLEGLYHERTFAAGYGRAFFNRRYSVGTTVKMLQVSVGKDSYSDNALDSSGNAQIGVTDPALAGSRQTSAFTVDLGFLAKPTDRLSLGLSFQNITQPDVGFINTSLVPMSTRFGAAYRGWGTLFSTDLSLKQQIPGMTDKVWSFGAEKPFTVSRKYELAFRGGVTVGSRDLRQLSFGFGLRRKDIGFDYSFLLPLAGLGTTNSTQRISLSYRFASLEKKVPKNKRITSPVLQREFERSWAHYQRLKKTEGASAVGERALLKAILQKYGGCNIDLGAVQEELKILQEAVSAKFNDSWVHYEYLKSSGAPFGKKMDILAAIIQKYKGWPIDLGFVEQEQREVLKAVHSECDAAWEYYQYLRKTGASTASRKEFLEAILKKYKGRVGHLEPVERELINLTSSTHQ